MSTRRFSAPESPRDLLDACMRSMRHRSASRAGALPISTGSSQSGMTKCIKRNEDKLAMETMYADLKGKTVLVTGGASGLGFAIAKAFAFKRSKVIIVGRDEARLKSA